MMILSEDIFKTAPSTRASYHFNERSVSFLIVKHINLIDYMIILLFSVLWVFLCVCMNMFSVFICLFSSSTSSSIPLNRRQWYGFLFLFTHFSIRYINRAEKRFPKINYVSKIPRSCILSTLEPISHVVALNASPVIFILFHPPTFPSFQSQSIHFRMSVYCICSRFVVRVFLFHSLLMCRCFSLLLLLLLLSFFDVQLFRSCKQKLIAGEFHSIFNFFFSFILYSVFHSFACFCHYSILFLSLSFLIFALSFHWLAADGAENLQEQPLSDHSTTRFFQTHFHDMLIE